MKNEVESQSLIRPDTDIVQQQSASLLEVIGKAVADPRMDVEKMSRLLDLQERILADQRRTEFMSAMSELQAELPQINKDGRILVGGQERSRYARLEDLDIAIKPLLKKYGFSFSFNEEAVDGAARRYSARLSHRVGHFETKYITLPLDTSGSKNSVQSAGSTVSYAIRYLIKMHLNIVERGADTDGEDLKTISEQQALDIKALIQETNSNEKKFLDLIAGTDSIEKILARDFQRVINALETKRRERK